MKQLAHHIVLCFVAALLATGAAAQYSQATVQLDTNEITIGEQIQLQLEVITPKGSEVKWPELESVFPEPLELISSSDIDTFFDPKAGDIQVMTQNLVITAFDTGYVAVPPIPFPNDGDEARTGAFLVTVYDVELAEEAELNDIKGPMEVPFSWWDWVKENWHWLLGSIVLFGGLVWLLVYLTTRKTDEVHVVFSNPVDPPHEIALRQLDALKEAKLWQDGKVKEYHTQLSDIFRTYLEKRFNIPALEQTSDEIMTSLRTVPIHKTLKDQLEHILVLSDLVKFAKEQPLPTENEIAMDNIYRFVRDTVPAPTPGQPQPQGSTQTPQQ